MDIANCIEKLIRESNFEPCKKCPHSETCINADAVCVDALKEIIRGNTIWGRK